MAIEVIGRHVEHAGDRASRFGHQLDLERRQLEDHPVGVAHAAETVEHGDADIAAEVDALTAALEDGRDQCRRGRLAIGAGDPADARTAALEDEVHLAAHRHAVGARDLQLGRVPGHARARADHQRPGRDVVGIAAEAHVDRGRQERDALTDRQRVRPINDHDLVSLPREAERAGEPAAAGSDHHNRPAGHEAGPATRANRTVRAAPAAAVAANAATRRCSRSPSSSKW